MISFRRRSAFLCVAVLSICACTLSAEPGTIYVDTSTAAAADGALRHEPVRSPNTAVDDSPSTTLSGVLEALVIDDFAQGTAEMRYYLRSDDGTSLKIHFSAAPRLRPGARFTVAGQMMGEVFFASTYHEMSPSVSMLAYSVSEDEHVVGEQGTLVLLFNFQDAPNSQPATVAEVEDMVFNASDPVSVNFMLQENSYGKTWLSGDVLGWLTLPINAANCFPTYIGTRTGLQNVIDFVDSQVNFSLYRRIILIHSGDGCLSGGAGSFGEWSIQTDEGALEMSMATTRLDGGISIFTARTILHELGHNFKIPHQDDLECGEAVVGDYADGCDPINRGNRYDHMANNTTGHDNASTKHRLGWFDPQNIAELGTGTHEITLYPLELPSGQVQTVRIPAVYNLAEGNESAYYVIEYRQAIGLDWLFDELVDPEAGVLILLEEDEYLIGPVLLDVSPHTTTEVFSQLDDSADAYLSLGESFIDTGNGISITFSGLAAGAAVLTIDVPRVCGDGTCHPGEDSCNCPSDCGPPDPADCTLNDVPDECEPDCNNNGVADICEIADGASDDCPGGTGNGVPDECDPQVDCNSNGVIDSCDISGDTRGDLNANGIPDDCEFHAVIYVDMGNCPGPGSGTIQDPFCNIQDAIDAQDPGAGENEVVEIVLVDGIYTGDRNKNLDFAGRLITVRSINGPENCIIDMEGVGRGFNFHSGESAGARVEGLTIRNGLADASLDRIGGAIYCQESSPTIVDCTISGNTAESKGGGIYLESRSNPTIRDCRITNNSALPSGLGVTYGGGIYCEGSSPSISGCVISNNEAFGIFGTAGGGIALSRRSNPTIKACTIANNSTNGRGGGIRCEFNSSPTIRDCLIEGNLVVVSPDNHFLVGDGGGISASGSRLTIDRCTIKENAALHGGGISIGWDLVGGVVIRNCLITSNRASGGGGIRLTITGLGDTAAIENCTITENTRVGSFDGAGIFLWQNTLEQGMDVTNCILWGNRAAGNDISEAAQIGGFNEILAVNYSNIQGLTGALGGVGNIGDDPLFVSGTDQRLTECSPCIHAGNNLAVTASSDLDGNPRIVNGVVDMGAYELIGPPPVLCQPGTFNAAGGMACEEPCQPCPAGTFQPEEAGTECFPCAAGSFAGTPGTELCTPCPLGAFQLWPGQIECLACDPGTFAPTTGMLLCNPCPGETFQPSMGATQCDACDCDDNNICTTNDCHAATGSCENDLIAGCIPAASTWSLICLALLLVCVATILMPRALGRGR